MPYPYEQLEVILKKLESLQAKVDNFDIQLKDRYKIFKTFSETHAATSIPNFKKCMDHCQRAALSFQAKMESIHEQLQHPVGIYINEIIKLHGYLTDNPDENHIKSSQHALKDILKLIPDTTAQSVQNDSLLYTESQGLNKQINVILNYIEHFFTEKEKMATMQRILKNDSNEYLKLIAERDAVRIEAAGLMEKSNPVKKKESTSSSATPSTTRPSTLPHWHNHVADFIKESLNIIERDVLEHMQNLTVNKPS